jgi:hypothetical protein
MNRTETTSLTVSRRTFQGCHLEPFAALKQAAEKASRRCHPESFAVILSLDSRKRLSVIPESGRGKRVMNLLNPNSLRVHFLESGYP